MKIVHEKCQLRIMNFLSTCGFERKSLCDSAVFSVSCEKLVDLIFREGKFLNKFNSQ